MFVLAATTSRSEPGNYSETVAELDEPKLKSENVLAYLRVRDSTLTLRCVTLADFLGKRRRSRGKWLGGRDSNPDNGVQSAVSYR